MKFLPTLLAIKLVVAAAVPLNALVKPLNGECSFTLTGNSGSFSSVSFPEDYSSNSNCSWLIITGGNTYITLRFDTFLTQANADFVTVYDGATTASPVLGTFSGFTVPRTVFSTSNVLTVTFTSDATTNYAGFQAHYTATTITTTTTTATTTPADDCGGIEVGSGLIQSPNYPFNYPNNIKCIWYLKGNSASAIALEFLAFDTERKVDYVEVYENWNPAESQPVATYEGNLSVPFTYATSATNLLSVRFVTDATTTASGFQAFFS